MFIHHRYSPVYQPGASTSIKPVVFEHEISGQPEETTFSYRYALNTCALLPELVQGDWNDFPEAILQGQFKITQGELEDIADGLEPSLESDKDYNVVGLLTGGRRTRGKEVLKVIYNDQEVEVNWVHDRSIGSPHSELPSDQKEPRGPVEEEIHNFYKLVKKNGLDNQIEWAQTDDGDSFKYYP